jgi:3-hydroxyisobutyrate dehydrogenase-like beta-hydroxyacid dehydrogenase
MSMGFVGLGHIGKELALKWALADEEMWVFDVVADPVQVLVAAGARAASSVAELARECDLIGVCVRNDDDVEQLLYGSRGLLENARPGTVVAIHSTVLQDSVIRWNRDAAAKSIRLVDAPVTRNAKGIFGYMLAGDGDVFARCEPIMSLGGNTVIEVGGVGAGIALKLCNNMMTYAAIVAAHEAFRLAQACGLSAEKMMEIGKVNGVVTPQMSAFLTGRIEAAKRADGAAGASGGMRMAAAPAADLGKKDLRCALDSAEKLGVKLPATQLHAEIIEDVFFGRY